MPAKKWNPETVLEAIRQRQRRGLPLNTVWKEDAALYAAAIQQLGSWQKALVALGVPGARPHEKWPCERVLAAIRKRQQLGRPLTETCRDDPLLYAAALRRFGSWRQAVEAAGTGPPVVPLRRWTRQSILEEIQARCREGRCAPSECKTLKSAASRHFGSWREAVRIAGVVWPARQSWSHERVIAAIQAWSRNRCSLTTVGRKNPALSTAAYKYFGSWHAAVQAAGIPYAPRRRWTRPLLIQAIREWDAQPEPRPSIWTANRTLAVAAGRHFGSWHAALRAAGIEPQVRLWTPDEVLIELRAWRQSNPQAGLSVENRKLADAACRCFGSCRQALQAAGVEPRPRKWTAERIIAAIQDRYVQGRSLSQGAADQDVALISAARTHFGSWNAARQAAGLPVQPRRRRTHEELLSEIRDWHRRGLPLNVVRRRNHALYTAASRRFGNWSRAVAAAGLTDSTDPRHATPCTPSERIGA